MCDDADDCHQMRGIGAGAASELKTIRPEQALFLGELGLGTFHDPHQGAVTICKGPRNGAFHPRRAVVGKPIAHAVNRLEFHGCGGIPAARSASSAVG